MGFKCLERLIRRMFSTYGQRVGKRPKPFLITPLIVTVILGFGLIMFQMDTDIGKLFTPHNAGSMRELKVLKQFSRIEAVPANAE